MNNLFFDLNIWANILLSSFVITTLLVIWFETDAFAEYARVLGFKLEKYENSQKVGLDFTTHLALKYDCFIVRLITCPICLCVWLAAIGILVLDYGFGFFFVFYFSMMKYFLFKFLMHKSDN